jgi:hypothetical protein
MVCVINTYLVDRLIILDQHLEVSTKNEKDKNNELAALSHSIAWPSVNCNSSSSLPWGTDQS